jgi:four helix bundle protein
MDFVIAVYEACSKFPDFEKYALCSQLRRAVVSVPANIAEGYSRKSTKEYIQFLCIALGSLTETETHLEIAKKTRLYLRGKSYVP